ncbi:MAG: FADH2 O2-dependent halogenase [Myxococcota bacterium]|jgi:FADH2 O2-dependent halogenase
MRYDVAILGSGLGGTVLGAILARQGLSVLILEAGTHPRFAIGESLIPETSLRFKLLAARYDVPEIGWLGTFHELRDRISAACGVKRSFAFAWHEEGKPHQGPHSTQLPTLTPPVGPDAHLFRQDTDAWMLAQAIRYGATVRQRTRATRIVTSSEGVVLHTESGEVFEAELLVDGAGHRSPMAAQHGLREDPPRLRTDSRCLFTHMVGVTPYDQVGPSRRESGMPVPWSQSTLHHCFDGGWFWIIPFDNHDDATNPLCSVGLLLDRRKHPTADPDPEAEFRSFVARFPSVAAQLEGAKAVRPWISTGRLQYSSRQSVGERFVLLPHATGFVDPLYSSGLSITVLAIDQLASRIIAAHRASDWSQERFADLDPLVQEAIDHYDIIVSRSFDVWQDFALWNAWNRVWALGNYLGTWGVLSLYMRYKRTGDRRFLEATDEPGHRGVLSCQLPEFVAIRDAGAADIDAVTAGTLSSAEAAERILARIDALDFLPAYMRFGKPEGRAPTTFTLLAGARHILWYRFRASPRWREWCRVGLLIYAGAAAGFLWRRLTEAVRRGWQPVRDTFRAHNRDWKPPEPR